MAIPQPYQLSWNEMKWRWFCKVYAGEPGPHWVVTVGGFTYLIVWFAIISSAKAGHQATSSSQSPVKSRLTFWLWIPISFSHVDSSENPTDAASREKKPIKRGKSLAERQAARRGISLRGVGISAKTEHRYSSAMSSLFPSLELASTMEELDPLCYVTSGLKPSGWLALR